MTTARTVMRPPHAAHAFTSMVEGSAQEGGPIDARKRGVELAAEDAAASGRRRGCSAPPASPRRGEERRGGRDVRARYERRLASTTWRCR